MKIGSIVIRCYEFSKMLEFWQKALHYIPREPGTENWIVLTDPKKEGPNISLKRISAKHIGKRSKLHLDLYTDHQNDEVERLVQLGAKRYDWKYEKDDDFIVLSDPDDNLFCVVEKSADKSKECC